jgi:hypothetical protein
MLQNYCEKYKFIRRWPLALAFQGYPYVTVTFHQLWEIFSSDGYFLENESKIDIFCLNYSLQKFVLTLQYTRNSWLV